MSKTSIQKWSSTPFSQAEKIGQLFMPAAFINDSEVEIQKLEKLIKEHAIGGLCFFHSRASAATNYEGKKEVIYNKRSFDTLKRLIDRYQNIAKYPLLIAIDAEWGLAMRIENTPQYPYAITLGAIQDNNDLIYEVGRNIARDCKAAGIHWNLAPVTDINNNPENPVIGYRSFGENKDSVLQKALAYIKGSQSESVLTSIKHFPGHGDTSVDSHLGLPLIDKSKQELLENELYPFQKLIDEGVDSVMVGHLSVPALANGKRISSSISKDIIKGLLREEMGFDGIVISDALNMHAVSKNYPKKGELEWLAFDAGNDVLCFAEHPKEGIETILKNATHHQIEKSFERIWELKKKVFAVQEMGSNSELENNNELNTKLAKQSLTLFKGTRTEISKFKEEGFLGVEISRSTDNLFFNAIQKSKPFDSRTFSEVSRMDSSKTIETEENILLALFPPQIKPVNKFGFTEKELQIVNELITTKNTVLYLFGNPYVLKHMNYENASAVVIVYQDLELFQNVAAQHFLDKIQAKGKLPISVKK
ncbi:glycoside hydrolase family 3 protein [Ulvibacterium marinum]|uniref:beta-N-acetylhexosaminidase n=1 Tax=Ulvibacterium marinum TaxID=2419782 RepID=A0A3B0BXA0_9FLAO|nr:glycoside hydrolase family 3 N-terminal domain-containing protein [Ulvibacterium marinum]RKN77038.1 glycoside hydrolase family 3 protein [Ulvibacterium marinum]